ncbi:MAG: VOC family protein [Polyangiaceae bacterium]|nr:VOC family protein [Polyangiaceae bacterium]
MIDHIGLSVRDIEASKRFYTAALAPLGYKLLMEFPGGAGFGGPDGKPDFWIGTARSETIGTAHVAFAADHPTVDAFHAAALAAGGKDNGAPGLRPEYHPAYYGAFVLDPDGHNIEAVSHTG